jgi:hypothetical protein
VGEEQPGLDVLRKETFAQCGRRLMGVLAGWTGVGTSTFKTCPIVGARSIRISMPPELILIERAFPRCSITDWDSNASSS